MCQCQSSLKRAMVIIIACSKPHVLSLDSEVTALGSEEQLSQKFTRKNLYKII